MTAAEIWAKFGGLIAKNERWLLVDLHKIDDVRASKPIKNIRLPYQVMMNDVNQSLPVKFRSLRAAYSFLNGEMESDKFCKLLDEGKAKMYFGRGK